MGSLEDIYGKQHETPVIPFDPKSVESVGTINKRLQAKIRYMAKGLSEGEATLKANIDVPCYAESISTDRKDEYRN